MPPLAQPPLVQGDPATGHITDAHRGRARLPGEQAKRNRKEERLGEIERERERERESERERERDEESHTLLTLMGRRCAAGRLRRQRMREVREAEKFGQSCMETDINDMGVER